MICFHHNDADGRCAAFWVSLSAGIQKDDLSYESKFIEMDYSKAFPFEMIHKDEQVYIVDFSISPEDMDRLLEITKNVTWIDHHVTAISKYKNYPYNIRGVRYDGVAGCMLTYCYLHHMTDRGSGPIDPFRMDMTTDAPYFTKLIADWDVWKFEYGDDTRAFITAFNSEYSAPDSRLWDSLVRDEQTHYTKVMIERGEIMLQYRDGFMADYCKLGFPVQFEGCNCFAINIGDANSEFFKSIANDGYDILMPFSFNGSRWTVSLYANRDGIDVSEIAKKYGGGGHVKAAGFVCNHLPFLNSRDILHRTVVYECDQMACGDKCTYPTCRYTFDIAHAINFEPSGVKDDFIEKGWIPIGPGCKMPDEGEEVLITLWMDESHGRGSKIIYSVDIGFYCPRGDFYIPDATGKHGFNTQTDWIEGDPTIVVAWKPKSLPFTYSFDMTEKLLKVWKDFRA